jgi:beta-N-acetylhexosaminidase
MHLDRYTTAPFNLDSEALEWVETTFNQLTLDGKIAQLFVLISQGTEQHDLDLFRDFQPGGITRFFGSDLQAEHAFLDTYRDGSTVPPLISADLEGSRMSMEFGTPVPNPLGLAAVDDDEATRQVSRIIAEEALAMGVNWSFAPVLDVNAAFRSAIVATRSFGSDVEAVERHALIHIETLQEHGIAATAKHWPGEGYDDRDQHLVTTINPLELETWEAVFGRLYRAAIEAGVKSVMSAHIALPSFVRALDPDAGIEAFRPASINPRLNNDLLRDRLGFNGLIVSDATPMAGLSSWCSLDLAIPQTIASGCDMVLFPPSPQSNLLAIKKALESGTIPKQRLEDAVRTVLALKASLGLHRNSTGTTGDPAPRVGTPENLTCARSIIERAPTLVKDTQNLLPLRLEEHRRVLVITGNIISPTAPEPIEFVLPRLMEDAGFSVTLFTPGTVVDRDNFDLVLYLFGEETLLTRGRIFLDWAKLSGSFFAAMDRHWHDIPTAMISFGYPYYLYDAPRVPTYINAYSTLDVMQAATLKCLLGQAEWHGKNPVDPFCGLEDAQY